MLNFLFDLDQRMEHFGLLDPESEGLVHEPPFPPLTPMRKMKDNQRVGFRVRKPLEGRDLVRPNLDKSEGRDSTVQMVDRNIWLLHCWPLEGGAEKIEN